MHIGLRPLFAVTAALVALSVITGRSADPTYSAIQLQLADLLIAEERFPEALEAFTRAKEGATTSQLFRARRGIRCQSSHRKKCLLVELVCVP